MNKSKTYIATPPGATIKEQLKDRGLSQKEFATRMDMSEKHISKLINGDVQLTPEVAVRLEMVLGVPAKFWNNLESIYRDKLIKVKNENEMDVDIELLKKFPYKDMEKLQWIQNTSKTEEKVINLRKYFEVVSLTLLEEPQINRIACRKLNDSKKSDFALLSWAQKAKLEAREIDVQPINIKLLNEKIPEIRIMTKDLPEEFTRELKNILANCGIALVFLPHIKGSGLHGATFYDGKKIIVGLTVRGKDADKFWFSLFHELAHIVYGHIGQIDGTTKEDEEKADFFAQNTLIPKSEFSLFISNRDFSKKSIINFSNKIKIDEGIIVGRLQKEGYIKYYLFNELKTKYEIS